MRIRMLEQFRFICRCLKIMRGGIFLRKVPLGGYVPVKSKIETAVAALVLGLPFLATTSASLAQTTPDGLMPPKTWVDKDTGHRVWRLTDERNSGGSAPPATPCCLCASSAR